MHILLFVLLEQGIVMEHLKSSLKKFYNEKDRKFSYQEC